MPAVVAVEAVLEPCERLVVNTWRERIHWWFKQAEYRAFALGHLVRWKDHRKQWRIRQQRTIGLVRCIRCGRGGAVDSDGGPRQFSGALFKEACTHETLDSARE